MLDLPLRLGLTMWSHSHWQQSFYGKGTTNAERLEKYAHVFHCVEGNTTFYATPSASTVQNWRAATHDDFRFTFKLPKAITHQQMLNHSQAELKQFLSVMEPLQDRIGQWTIQLPAAFSFQHLDRLKRFCSYFPKDAGLGVEVRNMIFFNKREEERLFNQWLIEKNINRIIMDSRPVFAAEPSSAAVIDAQQKKPKVPVHAISTSSNPMIRFIGHPNLEQNVLFFKPWISKLPEWIAEGKQPYLMIHTPDNIQAPELAEKLYTQLQQVANLPTLNPFPANDGLSQITMF